MNKKISGFKSDSNVQITRLTALWALSESALGGILHAVHIPFRGMILSSAAVIIISLIASYSDKKGSILKATIIVLGIKVAISPHTPIAAYFSVFMQGLLGELVFYSGRFHKFSSLTFGAIIGLLTGFQRFITLTIIFGMSMWDALNQFIQYVLNSLVSNPAYIISINFSLVLVTAYVGIHILFGLAAGSFASNLPYKINSNDASNMIIRKLNLKAENEVRSYNQIRKENLFKSPIYIGVFILLGLLLIFSYIQPDIINLSQKSIVLMLIRSILILSIWYLYLSPLLLKIIRRILDKRQTKYTNEINRIILHIPVYKQIASIMWKSSSDLRGIKRINYLITGLLVNVLTLELPD